MRPVIATFKTPNGWRQWFWEQEPGSFVVKDGRGVLTATSHLHHLPAYPPFEWPAFLDQDYLIILLNQLLSFSGGYTIAWQFQRTADDGGRTEAESGWRGNAVVWHIAQDDEELFYNSPHGHGDRHKERARVWFTNPNPLLRCQVMVDPKSRTIHTKVYDVTHAKTLIDLEHEWPDIVHPVYDDALDRCGFDIVATSQDITTRENPVAVAVDWLTLEPLDLSWFGRLIYVWRKWWAGIPEVG